MTQQQPRNPGVEERIALTADTVRPGTCTRCGAEVLRARAGRIAALDVVADPEPITPLQEIHTLLAGRLTWHLVTEKWGVGSGQRITWRGATNIQAGPAKHPVVADHECPPQPVQERLL